MQSLKIKKRNIKKDKKRQEIIFDHAGDSGVQSTWMGSGDEAHKGVPIWQRQQRVTRIDSFITFLFQKPNCSFAMDNVKCMGNETTLKNCQYSTVVSFGC